MYTKENYNLNSSKPLLDRIGSATDQYYSFIAGKFDFIINYDIKYLMGKELLAGEEEDGDGE